MSVFESGAILLYLAGKTGKFIPKDLRGQVEALEWLMWQMGGLGPMLGQNHHFAHYAPEKIPYAIDRYVKETSRLYGVLDKRLAGRRFILGRHVFDRRHGVLPVDHSGAAGTGPGSASRTSQRWHAEIRARPATTRAYAKAKEVNPAPRGPITEQERKILYGQDRSVVK